MVATLASDRVNSVRNDDPALLTCEVLAAELLRCFESW